MENRQIDLHKACGDIETVKVLDDYLNSEFKESVVSKYNSRDARDAIGEFGSSGGEATGSNLFRLIHLQESGLLGNYRLAKRHNIEAAKKYGLNLSGNSVDIGVALTGKNSFFKGNRISAKNLISQMDYNGISLGRGRLIPVSALTMKENSHSEYGLALSLREDIRGISFPEIISSEWDQVTGEGLSVAYLGIFGCFNYGVDDLSMSNSCERVVVVGPKKKN